MATDLGWEKWDEPFVADPVTAFVKDRPGADEVLKNDKPSWGDNSKWPGYPLTGTIGPYETLVLPDNYRSAHKQKYPPTPNQLAAEHLNSVKAKVNKKLRRTKKYGNHNTRKSTTNPQT